MRRSGIFFISIFSLCTFSARGVQTANVEKNGVILKGYDPVTYFTQTKPQKGSEKITAEHEGIIYRFSTEANKADFLKTPSRFVPAYEGWCATAVAGGYKYDIDPENYQVTNGRLFLFYKGWRGDAKKEWIKDETKSIQTADKLWPTVKMMKE